VARGRSAHFSQSQGKVADANLKRTEQRFTAPEKSNMWPQAKLHTQWPGGGQAGDPVFDQFYASQFPSLSSFPKQQQLNTAAGIALFDKIGPAVLMIHSQSGTFIWPIADARPNLVRAVIAVEPNGPPVYETDLKGAPAWFADMGIKKRWGLGEMPITYDPPLKDGEELAVVRQDKPDGPDLVRCWQQAEPARKLPKLAGIPMLIVVSEASYHASYDHCTANWLTQAGVRNTMIRLGDAGVHGNGHMMMLEKNSDDIAAVMRGWLLKALPAKS
jgi:pimeloyl-ACP methyl ester carboxylesterase